MKDEEALNAARRQVQDAIDSLDELSDHSKATVIALALLTGARIAIDARLADGSENGS